MAGCGELYRHGVFLIYLLRNLAHKHLKPHFDKLNEKPDLVTGVGAWEPFVLVIFKMTAISVKHWRQ